MTNSEKEEKDYIQMLDELRIILTDLLSKEKELREFLELLKLLKDSKVERYSWFADHSTYKKNCKYAKKAREVFEEFEEKKITDKISEIYNKYVAKKPK
jgi:hypothetical protein